MKTAAPPDRLLERLNHMLPRPRSSRLMAAILFSVTALGAVAVPAQAEELPPPDPETVVAIAEAVVPLAQTVAAGLSPQEAETPAAYSARQFQYAAGVVVGHEPPPVAPEAVEAVRKLTEISVLINHCGFSLSCNFSEGVSGAVGGATSAVNSFRSGVNDLDANGREAINCAIPLPGELLKPLEYLSRATCAIQFTLSGALVFFYYLDLAVRQIQAGAAAAAQFVLNCFPRVVLTEWGPYIQYCS